MMRPTQGLNLRLLQVAIGKPEAGPRHRRVGGARAPREGMGLRPGWRFDVAFGRPAIWQSDTGEVRGFVSRMFHGDDEEQYPGAEIIESGGEDDRRARITATLPVVRAALERLQHAHGGDLLTPFLRMLAFDA